MKNNNSLASSLVITVATGIVIAYCYFYPDYATAAILIYLSTLIFMTLSLSLIGWLYKKNRSSVDDTDIADIAENLNTEMILWTDDLSYIHINKKLRSHLGYDETIPDPKAALMTVFGAGCKKSKKTEEDRQSASSDDTKPADIAEESPAEKQPGDTADKADRSGKSDKKARRKNKKLAKAEKKKAKKSRKIITREEQKLIDEVISKAASGASFEARFRNKRNSTVTIAWSTSLVKRRRKNTLYLSTGFNMTEIRKMRLNLNNASDLFNSSMELAEIGVIMSTDKKKFRVSPEMVRMLGLRSSSLSLNEIRSIIHPNDRIQFDSAMSSKDTKDVKSIDMRIKSANSIYRWYSFRYKFIEGTKGNLPLFGGTIIDVTQEHEKDMLIERLAYIDEVTEIANRNKLMDAGQKLYECCGLLDYSYYIIVFDIDRFHIINDTCGYSNGNYILKNFAHTLYKCVTPGGLAARISGDNFALVLRDYGDDELPLRTAHTIQDEFAKLAVDEFSSISLSCSAGYSRMPADGESFLDVLEHAEFALKSGSGNRSIFGYSPSMHDSIIGNTEMEKSLAVAIDRNELKLFYQPKIDLETGKIMGVEALIRWIKPDGTIINPDQFVPIAESSHLIGKISEFVLNEGCRQNKLWQKMGFPEIVMSINFTSTDFYQADLKEKVFEALAKSGLEPKWLEVELTETLALHDIDFAVSQMNKLRELGVKLAMDDFGTGYSSLSYLQILPITLLKLDRSFITDIEHDNIAYEIVSAVIRIAKSKKIETIAEGIENPTQEEILRMAGCDYAQGFLYGKPMPPEKLEKLFDSYMKQN